MGQLRLKGPALIFGIGLARINTREYQYTLTVGIFRESSWLLGARHAAGGVYHAGAVGVFCNHTWRTTVRGNPKVISVVLEHASIFHEHRTLEDWSSKGSSKNIVKSSVDHDAFRTP